MLNLGLLWSQSAIASRGAKDRHVGRRHHHQLHRGGGGASRYPLRQRHQRAQLRKIDHCEKKSCWRIRSRIWSLPVASLDPGWHVKVRRSSDRSSARHHGRTLRPFDDEKVWRIPSDWNPGLSRWIFALLWNWAAPEAGLFGVPDLLAPVLRVHPTGRPLWRRRLEAKPARALRSTH